MASRGETTRWFVLPFGIIAQIASGAGYAFGIYSTQLKGSLGLSQTQLNVVASVGNIGGFTGLDGGLLYDRYGPKPTLLVGGLMCALGYFLVYLATDAGSGWASFPMTIALFTVALHGSCFLDMSIVSTNVKNFSQDRGLVVGVMKSFYGLSSSIIGLAYLCYYAHSSGSSHALASNLVIVCGVCNCLGRMFFGIVSDKLRGVVSRPWLLATGQLIMASGSLLLALAPNNAASDCPATSAAAARGTPVPFLLFLSIVAGLCALLAVPFVRLTVSRTQAAAPRIRPRNLFYLRMGYVVVLCLSVYLAATATVLNSWKSRGVVDQGWHASAKRAFAPIVVIFFAALFVMAVPSCRPARRGEYDEIGGGDDDFKNDPAESDDDDARGAVQNSVRQATLWEALRMVDMWLLSIAQFLGVGVGILTINNLGQIATSLGSSGQLYASVGLICFAYGAYFTLTPVITSELFGNRSYGSLYSWMNGFPAYSALIYNVGVASAVYTAHQKPGENCCLGGDCYAVTYYFCAVTNVLAALLAAALAVRNRRFYSQQQYEGIRGRERAEADTVNVVNAVYNDDYGTLDR